MRSIIQKIQIITLAVSLLSGVGMVFGTGTASAAAPTGMCYFRESNGVPAHAGACSDQPRLTDKAGHSLSKSKCYDVTGNVATSTLSCSNPLLDKYSSIRASCISHGGTFNEKTHKCSGEPTNTKCPDGGGYVAGTDTNKCTPANTDPAISGGNCSEVSKCDLIQKYVNPFVNFLSALIGVVVVLSIVIGGLQYGSSGGDPQKVTAAKNRIRNAIIALVTFIFLYALLNFLIPGGLV